MATTPEMFGPLARFYRGNGEIGLMIKDTVWQDPDLGGLDSSDLDDGSADKNLAVSADQLTAALLRILYVLTNNPDFQDNPNNRVVATNLSASRGQIDFNDPQLFDTYDFSFQVRQPSSSGNLPDPDAV